MEITYKRPPWGDKKGPWIKKGMALVVILLAVGVGFLLSRYYSPLGGILASKENQSALYWTVTGAPQVGQKAPDLVFTDYEEGKSYKLSDLQGKVVLLNFWATWCPPCREEIPAMDAAYKDLKDKGFVIVAVSINQGGKKDIDQFKKNLPFSFPVALDPQGQTAKIYQVRAIPSNFLIDRRGKIADKAEGAVDWNSQKAREFLNKLLS